MQQVGKEKNIVFKSQNNLRIIKNGRNRGDWRGGVGLELPQIFAKVDLLTIDNDSDKKKIQTSSSSSKNTGNITLIHSM